MTVPKPITKIDFIITALSGGGAERVMAILANNFVERGYDVSLLTFNESVEGNDSFTIDSKIQRIKLHTGRFNNHKLRSLDNLLAYYRSKKNRPDVVISFLTLTNLITILVAKLYNLRIIVSEHTNHLRTPSPKFLTQLTKNHLYKHADFLTVLTAFDLSFYEKKGAKVIVMPNPTTFKPIEANDHEREKMMLLVGNLNRYEDKGFDSLLTLLPPIFEKFFDWKIKIIGEGPKGKIALRNIAQKLDIEDRVIFTGFQNNVADHMRNASIFILSSRFEGLPMGLLEAMSQGMACIAYDCMTGPSDIICDGQNGFLIDNQNKEEMGIGLLKLIDNRELRMRLSNNALKSLDNFSLETVMSKWEQLLKEL